MKNYVVLVGLGVLGAAVAWSEGPDTRTAAEPLDKSDEIRLEHPGTPQEIVTYRSTLMQGLSKHMKGASMIVRGQAPAHPKAMLAHAHGLHDVALFYTSLFPESSSPKAGVKSEAKQSIWDDPEGFSAANDRFKAEALKLLDAAKAEDAAAFKSQFRNIGRTCGGCHDDFRVDDD